MQESKEQSDPFASEEPTDDPFGSQADDPFANLFAAPGSSINTPSPVVEPATEPSLSTGTSENERKAHLEREVHAYSASV